MNRNQTTFFAFMFSILGLILLAGVGLPVPAVRADLPNRNTPTPAPQQDSGDDKNDKKDNAPIGAWINLQAAGAPVGGWSGVQWQNSAGGWENVEGWQGSLPQNTRWWVAQKDFGTGPFRWVISEGQGGPLLGTSESFNLPGGVNETVQVTIYLAG